MNILMTGGTGMIGRALTRSLIDDSHEVTILTRNPSNRAGIPAEAKLVWWDGKTTEGWKESIEQADAVVHLAGESIAEGRWTDERKRKIHDSRVLTGQALVKAIQETDNKPRVLVQSSAIGYYGPHGDEALDENSEPGNDYLAQLCVQWEAATAPVEELGVRRAIARTGIVLSMDGGALPRIVLPFKFFGGGKLGSGKQWWSWIHLVDQVRALRFLLEEEDAYGPFNLTATKPVPNREFASAVGTVMGRPSLVPVPSQALSTLFGEMSTVLLDGQRVIPRHLLELGFTFEYTELKKALREILA